MGLNNIRSSLFGFQALINVLLARFPEAESACSRGIELCPDLGYNYKLRAYTRIRQDNPMGAVEDCTTELVLRDGDAGVLALRAWASFQAGDYEGVVVDLERAMAIEPGRRFYFVDCVRLVDAYQILGRDREVVDFCSEIIKPRLEKSLLEELFIRRAIAHAKLGIIESAINDCTSAIRIAHPECLIDLLELRAQLYESEGRGELAECDRLQAKAIRRSEAHMSEWVSAGAIKRLAALCCDSLLVASLVVLINLFTGILVASVSTESTYHFLASVAVILGALPYLFLLSVLDHAFVFLSPFCLFVLIPVSILISAGGPHQSILSGFIDPVVRVFAFVLISMIFSSWLYRALMESSGRQATVGKLLANLQVTSVKGGRLSFWRATKRHFLRIVAGFPTLVAIAVLLFSLGFELPLFIRCLAGASSLVVLYLSIAAWTRPGIHNSLSASIVSDSFRFKH
ncbi:MAG: RDD family protein [Candidatus Obscuribacterales bacterium]